jgi:hypothetical protein
MPNIPIGLCQCGCGRNTTIAKSTSLKEGCRKGWPRRFVAGHQRRTKERIQFRYWRGAVCDGPIDFTIEAAGYKTPCWMWKKCVTKRSGYAVMSHKMKSHRAHKLLYELTFDKVPEGMVLDHLCRNRACVRPDHVEPVTCTENTRRGLGTKLTVEDVLHIRAMNNAGIKQRVLAEHYGVDPSAISNAVRGRNWADVPRRV